MSSHTDAADRYSCPDCRPDTRLVRISSGMYVLEIQHDASCPSLNRMTGT